MLKYIASIILMFSAGFAEASEFIQSYKGSTVVPRGQQPIVVSGTTKKAVQPLAVNMVNPVAETPGTITAASPRKKTLPKLTPPKTRDVIPGATDFEALLPDEDSVEAGDSGEIVSNKPNEEDSVELPIEAPRPAPKPVPRAEPEEDNNNNDADDSEVVTPPKVEVLPQPRPEPQPDVPGLVDNNPTAPTLYDLTNCKYNTACWSNSTSEKIKSHMKKIISNVAYINSLHGTKLDARYFLCTGWRESTYNPGALGGQGERGMFQVMKDTGVAALKKGGPPKLQEFKNYREKPETYMTKMVNSTLAQTEMSYMVLKMKILESKAAGVSLDDVLTGRASVETYKKLARRYNGAGAAANKYAEAISGCLRCLRASDGLPDVTKDFNYTSVDGCLAKAKH